MQARELLGADLELRSRQPFSDSIDAVLDSVHAAGTPTAGTSIPSTRRPRPGIGGPAPAGA